MRNSIKEEFKAYVQDAINEGRIDMNNQEEWHHILFNEDYYIIGYYEASEWLKTHNIDTFEAIGICIEYEKENFGEVSKQYDNSEETVNMLVYVLGEEWLNEEGNEYIEELLENELNEIEDIV